MTDYASLTGPGEIRIERILPGPIERIWAYLIEPDKRAQWFASGPMELTAGGKIVFEFDHSKITPADDLPPEKYKAHAGPMTSHGRVTRCEPPRLLAFDWEEEAGKSSEVTIDLTPAGGDVRLVLTHRRLDKFELIVGVSAGWHMHLMLLHARLEDGPPVPLWATIAQLEPEYEKRLRQALG